MNKLLKTIIFIIGFLFIAGITVYAAVAEMCYQETANISTVCGGLATGSYYLQEPSYCIDGGAGPSCVGRPYSTCNSGCMWMPPSHVNASLFVNYTKPLDATNNSLWQTKHGATIQNFTIPLECWNNDPLQFRINSKWYAPLNGFINLGCYGTSDWVQIYYNTASSSTGSTTSPGINMYDENYATYSAFFNGRWAGFATVGGGNIDVAFYEEAMYWDIESCVPDWTCYSYHYGSCDEFGVRHCLIATDLNSCGESYGGDYSEWDSACNPAVVAPLNITFSNELHSSNSLVGNSVNFSIDIDSLTKIVNYSFQVNNGSGWSDVSTIMPVLFSDTPAFASWGDAGTSSRMVGHKVSFNETLQVNSISGSIYTSRVFHLFDENYHEMVLPATVLPGHTYYWLADGDDDYRHSASVYTFPISYGYVSLDASCFDFECTTGPTDFKEILAWGFTAYNPEVTSMNNFTMPLLDSIQYRWKAGDGINEYYSSVYTLNITQPASRGGSSSSGTFHQLIVDANGTVVGEVYGDQILMPTPLSITGVSEFDFISWFKELWITIQGWFA